MKAQLKNYIKRNWIEFLLIPFTIVITYFIYNYVNANAHLFY